VVKKKLRAAVINEQNILQGPTKSDALGEVTIKPNSNAHKR